VPPEIQRVVKQMEGKKETSSERYKRKRKRCKIEGFNFL
jgi:hypothetical protein